MTIKLIQPAGWPRPKGYANAVFAKGSFIFTAGIIGWNEREEFEHNDLVGQFRQILINITALLAQAHATPQNIVRMTCYVTDKREYISQQKAIGEAWRDEFGKTFPCMAVIEVAGLIEDKAKIEIEATAVINES